MRRISFFARWPTLPIVVVLVVASCSSSTGDSVDTTFEETTTTETVATGPLELVGAYDGEDCSYEGPQTATLDDEISLTLTNDSADAAFLRMMLIPPDRLTDIEPQVGSDFDFSAGRTTFLNPTLYAEAGPFEESTALAFLPSPGTYLVECASVEGAAPDHVWWLATLDATP
ncbi:MAG: hypothetical protein QNJ71_01900 [Acidimicrobiia bacterium]|nr:hypothetical protein [Acidimicrobiia bacterium]